MLPAHVYDESMSEAQGQVGPAVMAPGRGGQQTCGIRPPRSNQKGCAAWYPRDWRGGVVAEGLPQTPSNRQAIVGRYCPQADIRTSRPGADRPDACRMASTATCNRILVNTGNILLGLKKPALACHVGWPGRSVTLPLDLQSYKKIKIKKMRRKEETLDARYQCVVVRVAMGGWLTYTTTHQGRLDS